MDKKQMEKQLEATISIRKALSGTGKGQDE